MKEMTIEETRQVELQILLAVTDYCNTHDLQYFLAYGTLLGAVRHRGFIPWDDDIDIHMPRKDYNQLLANFNIENTHSSFKLIAPWDKISCHSFAKIINTKTIKTEEGIRHHSSYGIDIDIFPLDGVPASSEEFERFYKRLHRVYTLHFRMCSKAEHLSLKCRLALPFLKTLTRGKKGLLKQAARLHAQYPYEDSPYIGAVESCFNSHHNHFSKEWFLNPINLEFEGHHFKAPANYHAVLTAMYGDYMTLPPKEKQVTHHLNKTYWKE